MLARLITFLAWALLAASVTFWALKLYTSAVGMPAGTAVETGSDVREPNGSDLARLLGAGSASLGPSAKPASPGSRLRLAAVIASPLAGSSGIALISIDGNMPRAFRVGAVVEGDLVLQSVATRTASLGPAQGQPAFVLELPSVAMPAMAARTPTAPAAPVPSVRMATPEDRVSATGRRSRLRGHLVQQLPDK